MKVVKYFVVCTLKSNEQTHVKYNIIMSRFAFVQGSFKNTHTHIYQITTDLVVNDIVFLMHTLMRVRVCTQGFHG